MRTKRIQSNTNFGNFYRIPNTHENAKFINEQLVPAMEKFEYPHLISSDRMPTANKIFEFFNDIAEQHGGSLNWLKNHARRYNVDRIVIEHTGNYQKEIVLYLQKHNLKVCVVNPSNVRNFAKAAGIIAKTDKIDAYVLAKYGDIFKPDAVQETDLDVEKLKELVNFRLALVETIKSFKIRLEKKPSAFIVKEINKTIKSLILQQTKIEKQIKELIQLNQNMTELFNKLNEIVGFGEHTITVLLAHLPELGKIERNKIAALCGVAPINHDSGKMRGLRCIQGGRKTVRNALYMATIPAIIHNHVIHEYYIKLKAEGKPSKVAIVACMRKLLCYANSLVKNL